jgi:hypothetical protein
MYKCNWYEKRHIEVKDEDAFSYAIEHCFDLETVDDFLLEFGEVMFTNLNVSKLDEFKQDVIDWFYSAEWSHYDENQEEDEKETEEESDEPKTFEELHGWVLHNQL